MSQTDKQDDIESTIPETTQSLHQQLTKLIKEQWELKEALKEQGVVIKQLKRDLNKGQFEITRKLELTTIAQQNVRGAIPQNLECHKKLKLIQDLSIPPEPTSEDTILLASMTWDHV